MSRRAGTFAASLLLLCAAAVIVRESRHPPCWPVTLGGAAFFVGKRVVLEGYARSNFGRSGRDYAISASERWSPPVLFVRPRPESIVRSGGEHVVVFGVLQNSPEGLLLVEESPAPPSAVFGFAILVAILAATWLAFDSSVIQLAGPRGDAFKVYVSFADTTSAPAVAVARSAERSSRARGRQSMIRRPFAIAWAPSLLLCVTTLGLWIYSSACPERGATFSRTQEASV